MIQKCVSRILQIDEEISALREEARSLREQIDKYNESQRPADFADILLATDFLEEFSKAVDWLQNSEQDSQGSIHPFGVAQLFADMRACISLRPPILNVTLPNLHSPQFCNYVHVWRDDEIKKVLAAVRKVVRFYDYWQGGSWFSASLNVQFSEGVQSLLKNYSMLTFTEEQAKKVNYPSKWR